MSRSRLAHGVLVAAMLAGCGESASPPPEPAPRSPYHLFPISIPGTMGETATILADGKAIGNYNPRDNEGIKFEAASDTPRLTVKVHLPCGWREVALEADYHKPFRGQDQHGKPIVTHGRIRAHVPLRTDHFTIDNRDGPDAILRIGELVAAVPGGKATSVVALAPDCEGGAELKLGERPLGTIPAPAPQPAHGTRYYFIDPGARRCYEYSTIRYSRVPGVGGKPPPTLKLRRQPVHEIPYYPQHLFVEAPFSVTSSMYGESRSQLLDVAC